MGGKMRKRGWFGKFLCGAALGVSSTSGLLYAEEPPRAAPVPTQLVPAAPEGVTPASFADPGPMGPCMASNGGHSGDPCAPAWCDPISRVPNFFGDFFARTARATNNTTLTFTGGREGAITGQ